MDTWHKKLLTTFGIRFLVFLVFAQLLIKGTTSTILEAMAIPLFKSVAHLSAAEAQIYAMICMLPWSIKPLIGLLADMVPKRGCLLVVAVIGSGAAVGLVFTNFAAPLLTLCYVGINLEVAIYDLLSEGKSSEIRKQHDSLGSLASTVIQGLQVTGSLIALSFVGILSDARLFIPLFLVLCGLCVSPIVPTLLGWFPENPKRVVPSWRVVVVMALCGVGGLATSLVTTLTIPVVGLGVSVVLLITCLVGCKLVFSREMTMIAVFQVVSTLSQPSMGTALDYFYTATPQCLQDGPHFSYTYYFMAARIIGALLSLAGVWIYGCALSRLTYRRVLMITTILISLAGLSDLFIVTRTNIRLGIPDKMAYVMGEAVLEPFLGMLNYIPIAALITIAVQDGLEASCFAYMAGLVNFARMISELSGSIIFTAAGIVASEQGPCNFDALPWLVLCCHVVTPLLIGIPAVWLVPDVDQ